MFGSRPSVHFHVVDKGSHWPTAYKYYETATCIASRDTKEVELCSSEYCIGNTMFNYTRMFQVA